ncbi:MAG: outer membrane beta-barrel protein [Candidatus Zixiibacteriota bacterium]
MRKVFLLCLLATGVLLTASSAFSQDYSRRFTLGLRGGFWKLGLTERSDTNTVGNLGALFFKYKLKERISLGFSASYARTWEADLSGKLGGGAGFSFSRKDGGSRSTQIWLDLSLIYSFRPWERTNPYLFGGVGLAFWNVKDSEGQPVEVLDIGGDPFDLKDQELTFSLGGGVEYRIKERWGLDFGTRLRILSHLLTDFKGSKDIAGARPGELDLPKATLEVFVGFNYFLGKLRDSDKDGVPDRVDICADTPRGVLVDERGCPLDSDGDGIYNGLDRCPQTPPGTTVDVNGCPLE